MERKLSFTVWMLSMLLLFLAANPMDARAAEAMSGTCGDSAAWELEPLDGDADALCLVVSGSGTMENYSYYDKAPWYHARNSIVSVLVNDGIETIGGSAFSGCANLTDIHIPDSVTAVGDGAFFNCASLSHVSLPDGVTKIGIGAFRFCIALTDLNIPRSLAAIGSDAFSYCCNLKGDIILPDGITAVKENTFWDCQSITGIVLPDSVTSIGDCAFIGCRSLTSLNIPSGVTEIGRSAFDGCSSLSGTFTLPDGVAVIEQSLFEDCSSLTEIHIPNGVSSVGYAAFRGCSSLTEMILPDSVAEIGILAFSGCKNLAKIHIPSGVTVIRSEAFSGCESLAEIHIPDGIKKIEYRVFSGCGSLRDIVLPDSVTEIEACAFSDCGSLADITLPDGLAVIEWDVFSNCGSLTGILLPDSVTKIEQGAFCSCGSLTAIDIPSGVTSIGGGAFSDCGSLTKVVLPDGVAVVEPNVFSGCGNLKGITLPNSVTAIKDQAFWRCANLTDIAIPDSVADIDERAFVGCGHLSSFSVGPGNAYYSSLNGVLFDKAMTRLICFPGGKSPSYEIPGGVTSIGGYAFADNSLSSVSIPDSVTSIGGYAFADSSLSSVSIPDSVTSIGDHAFEGCTKLASVHIQEGLETIGHYAFAGTAITEVVLPDSVSVIHNGAFDECTWLKKVILPSYMAMLGSDVFAGCGSLTDIVLPDGITSLQGDLFYGCWRMTSVVVPDSVTEIESYAFSNCSGLADVYYGGSETDWNAIKIDSDGNKGLINAAVHYARAGAGNGGGNGSGDSSGSGAPAGTDTSVKKHTIVFHSGLGNTDRLIDLDWGWDLLEQPSAQYNSRLAVAALALSNAAEFWQGNVEWTLRNLDFTTVASKNYGRSWKEITYPAVTFGYKRIVDGQGNDKYVFAVAVRGTKPEELEDVITDLASLGDAFAQSADNIYAQLENFIAGQCRLDPADIKGKSRFFITGHSLGGAVANLMAKKLNDAYGWNHVFAYTFAAPRSISSSGGITLNIFNILNSEDQVPVVFSSKKRRYGQDVWFSRKSYAPAIYNHFKTLTNGKDLCAVMESMWLFDATPFIGSMSTYAHAPETYMAYLLSRGGSSNISVSVPAARFRCPVDVEVYTSHGVLVGRVVNNKADSPAAAGAYIHVDGDEKTVYLLYEGEYTFRLTGTGSGTMEYALEQVDPSTDEPVGKAAVVFQNVVLAPGKKMASEVSVKDTFVTGAGKDGIELFVTDKNGTPIKSVLADGNGTEVAVNQDDTGGGNGGGAPGVLHSVNVSKITISGISNKIAAGKKLKLTAKIFPPNATNKSIKWESKNRKIATVKQSGAVTLKKNSGGKSVVITATAKDGSGIKASFKITSMKGAVKKISIMGKTSVKAGKSLKFKANVTAAEHANKKLAWKSSNKKYAKVNDRGKVKTYKTGKGKRVKITAYATDGSGKKKSVTIKLK